MRRLSILAFALLAASFLPGSMATAAEDQELERVRAKINAMFERIDAEDVTRSPVDGWYMIHKGSIVAYVSEDGRYLLQGDMIDLDQQINLSEQTRTDARRELIWSLEDDQVIAFSPANVRHAVTVFTDVDCTYCRKLHGQIEEYLAAGIEIRYLLYPRNGPASRAWATSENVWCARDRNLALTNAKLDKSFESNKCDSSTISQHYVLGQQAGLTGTPAIIFPDGSLVSGYLPPETLAARLDQLAAK